MKKRTITAVLLAVLLLLLSGCSSLELSSVDSLMRPPKLTGENAEIEAAFEASVESGYVLKSPTGGEYRSAYTLFDIDGDKDEEAFVFYCPSAEVETINFSVIDKTDDGWTLLRDFKSSATQVDSIKFADLNGDGIYEIIVGWNLFEKTGSRTMCVFRCAITDGEPEIVQMPDTPFSELEVIDIDNNGVEDLLLISSSTQKNGIVRQYARYLNMKDTGELYVVGELALDSSIMSFVSVETDVAKSNGNCRIYIDAFRDDGCYLTQCIIWNEEKLSFDSLLSDVPGGLIEASIRQIPVFSRDINGDGTIEFPVVSVAEQSIIISENETYFDTNVSLVEWRSLLDNSAVGVAQSLYNGDDGYLLDLPDSWWNKITVASDRDNTTFKISVFDGDSKSVKSTKELFTIKTVSRAETQTFASYYTEFATNNGNSYMYKITDFGKQFGVTQKLLSSLVRFDF